MFTSTNVLPRREATVQYRPYPFSWVPAEGQRHAATAQHLPSGAVFEALCGAEMTADQTEKAWLWTTCPRCGSAARQLAEAAQAANR